MTSFPTLNSAPQWSSAQAVKPLASLPVPADRSAGSQTSIGTGAGQLYSAGEVRLLVLDDDAAIGRLIQAALEEQPFIVDVVSEPGLMVNALQDQTYHLIILDYVLPGLDANEVLESIHAHQEEASVIVITGHPSVDSALTCLRNRIYDYLTKPFEVDQLKKAVMKCLDSRGLLRLSEEGLREQVGLAVRERRKALGMTLAEMANRTNLSLGYMSQVELGRNAASVETLYRIALALRTRLADLFQSIQAY